VGGYVRDKAIGHASRDLDYSVVGSVDQVGSHARRLAKAYRTRAHLLGRPPRAVWQLEADGTKIELWPLSSTSRRDDILRRDFTCNALAWALPEGPLIDLVGGLESIRNREIKAIRRSNLERDPVRLLRAARLVAQLDGFVIEAETRQSIISLAGRLAASPRERVGQELVSLFRSPRAGAGVTAMLDLNLFRHSSPRDSNVDFEWAQSFAETASRIGVPRNHHFRAAAAVDPEGASLAWIFRAWGIEDHRLALEYGWTRQARKRAACSARLLGQTIQAAHRTVASRREVIFRSGEAFPALFSLASAVDLVHRSSQRTVWQRWWRQWQRSGSKIANPTRFITPEEVIATVGCKPGPVLGEYIKELQLKSATGAIRSAAGARRWLRSNSSKSD
jgi:tRNA nucleotidyltransferase/poly(A) polymerase